MFRVCLWWKGYRSILPLVTKGTKHHYCVVAKRETYIALTFAVLS